ncbi:hypothetical protein [Haladaptatus cibarius]|uniref:hypothetical protein n=1 Tax=Haladaptatus cibarius TaxID=453847 RepID=UPI0006798FF3|nr:hypothetical protein [Haladaptatus cibarius]
MLEWLFPTVSNPLGLAALIAVRITLNVILTVTVARAVGFRTVTTAVAGTATFLSGALVVLIFSSGEFGLYASYAEFTLQAIVIVLAGYVIVTSLSTPLSRLRRAAGAVALIGAILVLLSMIPLYGDAFVAP